MPGERPTSYSPEAHSSENLLKLPIIRERLSGPDVLFAGEIIRPMLVRRYTIERASLFAAPADPIYDPKSLSLFTKKLLSGIAPRRYFYRSPGELLFYPHSSPDELHMRYPIVIFDETVAIIEKKIETQTGVEVYDSSVLEKLPKPKSELKKTTHKLEREIFVTICPHPKVAQVNFELERIFYGNRELRDKYSNLGKEILQRARSVRGSIKLSELESLREENPLDEIYNFLASLK